METTLNKIHEHSPCEDRWERLLESLNKSAPDNDPVSLDHILKSNGMPDAVWCLRCFDYLDICLFCADVAESVLPLLENKQSNDKKPRKAIEGIRLYKNKDINFGALSKLRSAAYAADAYVAAYAANPSYAVYTVAAADACVDAYTANIVYAIYADAVADAYVDAARKEQWGKTETLFVKHFCS